MKVIVKCRQFYDIEPIEIPPAVIMPSGKRAIEEQLYKLWKDELNALIDEATREEYSQLNEDKCFFEEDYGLITYEDGDTISFHIVDVEEE